MAEFDERDMVRRSFRHIAEARDAIDQTRAPWRPAGLSSSAAASIWKRVRFELPIKKQT
jgi:anti-sigma-K factor RskA